ncbi:MAG: hypothetical protein Q9159_001053 [Coniocarpon cinnabarinum]
MHFLKSTLASALLAQTCVALPSTKSPLPKIQHVARQTPVYGNVTLSERAQAVKNAFQFAWDGYFQNAFPADQLNPTSLTSQNPRNGWGASAIDGLDTALVMEFGDIANNILQYIPTINFGVSYNDESVSLFETTIRYIGGMLSAYDLLKPNDGPLCYLANDTNNVEALLTQAQNLANNLSYAFDTASGIPSNNLVFSNRSTDGATTNGLATVGTLVLEWTRLSDLLGDDAYAQLTQKAENYLLNPKPASGEPFPGLVGQNININDGTFADAFGGWIGGSDSFFEYLIKMYIYDPTRFEQYRDRWVAAADSTIQFLTSHPVGSTREDLTYVAEYNGTQTIPTSQHLACFDGGNFLLGGQVLGNQTLIDYGLQLVDACRNTYASTATGIGPEVFSWSQDGSGVPADQADFYNQHGFYIANADYDLRPEVIESYYYAYQITGNTMYQDWAWEAFVAINATCRTTAGFTEVSNVNVQGGGSGEDNQESFLFAETLKYLYLIQAPVSPYRLNSCSYLIT